MPNLDSNFIRMGFRILKMKYRIVFLKKILHYSNENSIKIEKNLLKWKKNLNSNDWKICQDHHNPKFLKFIMVIEPYLLGICGGQLIQLMLNIK